MNAPALRNYFGGLSAAAYARRLFAHGVSEQAVIDALIAHGKTAKGAKDIARYARKPPPLNEYAARQIGSVPVVCMVPIELMERLQVEADRRDIAVCVLASRIMATVTSENMIDAVLDDGAQS